MSLVERELDRVLTLLRNKIRERGFTQLQVQEQLSWGRSYISQLLTKQKSLRVEQVLLILNIIDVDPAEFYGELYRFPLGGAGLAKVEAAADSTESAEETPESRARAMARTVRTQVQRAVYPLVEVLIDKGIIDASEAEALDLELLESSLTSKVKVEPN